MQPFAMVGVEPQRSSSNVLLSFVPSFVLPLFLSFVFSSSLYVVTSQENVIVAAL